MAEQLKTKLLCTASRLGAIEPAVSTAADETVDGSNNDADVCAAKPSDALPPLPLKRRPGGGPRETRGPPRSSAPIGRKFLSYDDLIERGIRFSRVHIRRLERAGHFPMHVTLGAGNDVQTSIAWLVDEIETWEAARIAARDAKVERAGASAG